VITVASTYHATSKQRERKCLGIDPPARSASPNRWEWLSGGGRRQQRVVLRDAGAGALDLDGRVDVVPEGPTADEDVTVREDGPVHEERSVWLQVVAAELLVEG